MKKGKLLALLSVLMIAAMLLSSCGGAKKISKLGSFEKVLNSKYDYAEAVVEKATALTELDGYALVTSNEEFILFSNTNEETGMMTYKVFAYRSASVVATFSNNEERTYSVNLDGDLPMFVVVKATEEKTTYTAYDAKGTEVVTTKYATSAPSKFGELVRYDDVLYAIEDDGKLTKSLEIPENLSLSAPDYWNDQYYYFTASRNVLVYDASLNFVSAWYAPSTAAYANFFVLDGGNVLVQYMDILDPYTEDYEVYITEMNDAGTVVVKYDLVTKLIAAKDGKAKDLKMDYYLQYVESATEIMMRMRQIRFWPMA